MKSAITTLITLSLLGTNYASAESFTLVKKLENFCSAGLNSRSFTCGNPDLGYYNGHTDLNGNGIYDILEVGRTFTIDLSLPEPPKGFEYRANGPATIRLDTFGDMDSFPDLPPRVSDISANEHYDIEWIDVALDHYSLGRIFDGNLNNDAFDMGAEQDWWGDEHDRGTLWGDDTDAPSVVYGSATIPQTAFAAIVKDGKFSTSFGLAQDHNDLTGHPSFDNREEFIQVTLKFDADLVPASGSDTPPTASFTASPSAGAAPLNVQFDASSSTDAEGRISKYLWNFKDGSATTNGIRPFHQFTGNGLYNVELQVTDSAGQTTRTTRTINVGNTPPPTNTPPKASFTATPVSGKAPLTVQFDASASSDAEGPIEQYRWNFKDGSAAGSGAKPSHKFTKVGNYNVELTVTDKAGKTGKATKTIIVSSTPPANTAPTSVISADKFTGTAPVTINFSGTQSTDSDGRITGYTWNFGDGSTATSKTASHVFRQAGSWKVTLTVTDDKNATHSSTKTITVKAPSNTGTQHELLPILDVGATDDYDYPVLSIEKWDHGFVKFDLASISGDIESAILRVYYLENHTLTTSVWAAAHDQWQKNGPTPIEVGQSWTGIAPLASIKHNSPRYLNFPVTTFIKTEVAGDRIASFEIGNNKGGWQSYGSQESAFPARLVINTQDDGSTENSAPVAKFQVTPTSGPAPLTITMDASTSSDADGSIINYAWDLGNGVSKQGLRPSHVLTQPGTYTIKLTVTDNLSAKASSSKTVTVTQPGSTAPPIAVATATPTSAKPGEEIQFRGDRSSAPGGRIISWQWTFGDDSSSTLANPKHRYASPGTYSVKLTVTNDSGKHTSTTLSVEIKDGTPDPAVQVLKPTDDLGPTGVADSDFFSVGKWDHGFIKFDLRKIKGPIGSAKLRLHPADPFSTTTRVWHAGTDAWTEQNGRPVEVGYEWFDAPVIASRSHSGTHYFELDITALVKNEYNGDGLISLELGNNSNSWLSYSSSESEFSPELVIRP
jgi:PKD repeat protein